jgi:hypothetical protein
MNLIVVTPAGIREGARTGLAAVMKATLFLLSLSYCLCLGCPTEDTDAQSAPAGEAGKGRWTSAACRARFEGQHPRPP